MSQPNLWLPDTNALINDLEKVRSYSLVVPSHVMRELDKLKNSPDRELAYKARRASRYIWREGRYSNNVIFDLKDYRYTLDEVFDPQYTDSKLIQACKENGYGIISGDINLLSRAEFWKIPIVDMGEDIVDDSNYSGILELRMMADAEKYALMYQSSNMNPFNMVRNQYLVVWDDTVEDDHSKWKPKHIIRFDGTQMVQVTHREISNSFVGKIKPRNVKQRMLFNMLQDRSITVKACFGKYGTGKDFCMISHALDLVLDKHSGFEKLIWVRNNIELKDTEEIGFRKGSTFDKLLEFAMPLADHVGGVEGLRMLADPEYCAMNKTEAVIELQHIGTIRGRDIKNSIVYVTEVQNNTADHVKLLLGRIGEGSELWLNGDMKQVDRDVFAQRSGLRALKRLKGHELYGQVTLDKTERSKTAGLCELLES